ncbi:hypothetical protein [Francisella sp. 19X1-34]|uniref:hypothetical protein n=1 Tax=Francisella sp. 19X1-34 TaxID=3087177 RepID=UPI002E2F6E38|nr:hypothetical protein [Francisella sp. 19X1-34]MED7789418.1 hypothetical protein [Francisella sp. 19X1-34]
MLGESKRVAKLKIDMFKTHDIKSLRASKQTWIKNGKDKDYINQAIINRNVLSELMKLESKS